MSDHETVALALLADEKRGIAFPLLCGPFLVRSADLVWGLRGTSGGIRKVRKMNKVTLFSKEYPPYVYGGAGVHVEYLSQALAKRIAVEVRCFGDQEITGANLSVHGYPEWAEAKEHTDARYVSAVDEFARSLRIAKD